MNFARALLAASTAIASTAVATPPAPAEEHTDPAPAVYAVLSRETFDGALVQAREATAWSDRRGRELVVARLDAAQLAAVSRHVHEGERRCGGFFAFDSRPEAEAFLASDRSAEAIALPLGGLYTIDNQTTVDAWLPQTTEANIRGTIVSLSAYRNRYFASSYGRQAAEWIRDTWQGLAAGRPDAEVELFEDCKECSTQPSVILTVRGTELADEIVVIGGHLDSINWSTGNPMPEDVAPGADDDASGIATITEIIRIAMASGWQPKRTVKFMGYAAEEVGLKGSKAIARRFADDGAEVVGVLQLDMTNYKNGTAYDMQIISDNSNAALLTYFGELFDEYLAPRGFTRTSLACGYGCSDHSSWTQAGYPAGMLFEAGQPRPNGGLGGLPYVHSSGDTLANMDDSAVHSVKFAQFGLAFLGELAKTRDGGGTNQAPVAAFDYATERMTVRFTDTSSDADGTIASRHWDFGDGTSSTETNPVKTYDTVGTYAVALTVTDDGGLPNLRTASIRVDDGVVPLANGIPADGLAAQAGTVQIFTLDVPQGAAGLRFAVSGVDDEDADLSIAFDGGIVCESRQPTADETCAIADPPAAGAYTATVEARSALGGFSIAARFVEPGERIFADGFEP